MFKRKNTFYINKNYRRKTDDLKILILPIIGTHKLPIIKQVSELPSNGKN